MPEFAFDRYYRYAELTDLARLGFGGNCHEVRSNAGRLSHPKRQHRGALHPGMKYLAGLGERDDVAVEGRCSPG